MTIGNLNPGEQGANIVGGDVGEGPALQTTPISCWPSDRTSEVAARCYADDES